MSRTAARRRSSPHCVARRRHVDEARDRAVGLDVPEDVEDVVAEIAAGIVGGVRLEAGALEALE